MELYLDSVKIDEVREANKLGFLTGLTTTPTFMLREGITDTDAAILELSKLVNILHVEALGNDADEIVNEAERLLGLGLDKNRVVFKIPISAEGAKACKKLTDEGIKVNLHLVYTLQQAYFAFCAGATYVCVLVGRLQDQGHDALTLMEQCVNTVDRYNYSTKIMFSSVRNLEHVRDALNVGSHACTIPWNIFKQLPQNHFTELGIQQFTDHKDLLTIKAADLVVTDKVFLKSNATVLDGLMLMTDSKLGAVIVLDGNNEMYRIFTDGDLRRLVGAGNGEVFRRRFSELETNHPVSIESSASLASVIDLFRKKEVDNLVIVENNKPVGLIDIQDILKWI
ncbi:MAG: transaldolase family protein [Bacteroidales bacterium]